MKRTVMLALCLAACEDELDQRLAIVDEPRVLAVIAEPAEAKPGAQVMFHAIAAGPDGPIATAPRWAFCTAPKPPTEDNVVSDGCVRGTELADLGTADVVTGTLPADGCLRFGPDTPPGGFRPRAADGTGGYYQPVRADVDARVAFGLARITCKLPAAPGDVAHDYDVRYVANANPMLEPIALDRVPADADVTLTATWPADAVESYLYFDPGSQRLVTRRESMRVSWFATSGTLTVDATDVGEDDTATSVSTTWHTPGPGTAHLWFVLRDSRGGIAVRDAVIVIE